MHIKYSLLAISSTWLFACACSQNLPTSEKFNRKASEYFLLHFSEFDLSPLDDVKKCMLKKTVENDLDELNGSKSVILYDKFLIKNYFEEYLQLEFSFIQDLETGKFYFLSLPKLCEFIFDVEANYVQMNDTTYELKSLPAPVQLNSPLLDNFFSLKYFEIDSSDKVDPYAKFRVAEHILAEGFLLTNPSHKISLGNFVDQVQKASSTGLISNATFNTLLNFEERSLQGDISLDIFFIEKVGYILYVYSRDKETSRLKVMLLCFQLTKGPTYPDMP